MARTDDQDGFRHFANNLESALQKYAEPINGDLLRHQREQLRGLVDAETRFRKALIAHPWGPAVYRDFVTFICDKKKNILAARPYFRERQTTFTAHIGKALKKRNDKGLYRFRFNWSLVSFILLARKWAAGSQIRAIAEEIKKYRKEILEQNLPLAISQARIFWNCTPRSHLTYMDIVQIQSQGLLLAIDKFTPPNDRKMTEAQSLLAFRSFRAVAIGIMTRDRVNQYSETLLHFYPKYKLIIYRANKHLRKFVGDVDFVKLCALVNADLKDSGVQTTPEELANLVAGASTVSGDTSTDPEADSFLDSAPGPEAMQPDLIVEKKDLMEGLYSGIESLTLRERKMLKMKGVKQ
jgi:hypothetical protein